MLVDLNYAFLTGINMTSTQNNTKKLGMHAEDLNDAFFCNILKQINPNAKFTSFCRVNLENHTAIYSTLDSEVSRSERILGLHGFRISYTENESKTELQKEIAIKVKPKSFELWQGINGLIQQLGGNFAKVYGTKFKDSELCNTEIKDLVLMKSDNPVIAALRPKVFYIVNDPEREIFAYAMENIAEGRFSHVDSGMDTSCWTEADIQAVLDGMASFHALFYGRVETIPEELATILEPRQDVSFHESMLDLWPCFTEHAHTNFPELFDSESEAIMKRSFANFKSVCEVLDASPITLVHNDFNVRNLCLRKNPAAGEKRLCLYDWEIVRYGLPQHDLAEFLAFLLPKDRPKGAWQKYVNYYREALLRGLKQYNVVESITETLEKDRFQKAFDMSVIALFWNRLTSYHVVHYFANLPFMDRAITNATGYLKDMSQKYDFLK